MAYTLSMEIVATMTLISINRYIRIVQPVKYPFIFTQRSTAFLITVSWLLSILGNIFPLIGYGRYGLNNPGDYMCALQVSESVIQITVGGVSIIIAAIIIITCYVRVFCTIRAHNRRVRLLNRRRTLDAPDPHRNSQFSVAPRESRGEEIQIALTLFLLVVIFGICWSPTVVSVIINAITGQPTSHLAGVIRVNALVLETVADPIVYAIRNRTFRQVLKKTFKKHSWKLTWVQQQQNIRPGTQTRFHWSVLKAIVQVNIKLAEPVCGETSHNWTSSLSSHNTDHGRLNARGTEPLQEESLVDSTNAFKRWLLNGEVSWTTNLTQKKSDQFIRMSLLKGCNWIYFCGLI